MGLKFTGFRGMNPNPPRLGVMSPTYTMTIQTFISSPRKLRRAMERAIPKPLEFAGEVAP